MQYTFERFLFLALTETMFVRLFLKLTEGISREIALILRNNGPPEVDMFGKFRTVVATTSAQFGGMRLR